MKILLVSESKDLRELLSFQISSSVQAKVFECSSVREAVDLLAKVEQYDLVIGPFNGSESILLKVFREKQKQLPLILFYDPLIASPEPEATKDLNLLGVVPHSNLVQGVLSLVKEHCKGVGVDGDNLEFCPIRTTLLIRATPLKSDIYIKLSEKKFLKLFKLGDEFGPDDVKKYYEAKGVEYMYLRRQETREFLEKFKLDLDALLKRDDLPAEEALQATEVHQETIHDLVHRVGFTQEVQDLAKQNVQLTLRAIGSQPKLLSVLSQVTQSGNYLSHHSTLLAHIACCIAKEMQWGSDATFSKLVIAAYMHDISIQNPELAKIASLADLEANKSKFPEDQVKTYHLHPAHAADMVRSFKEIPADVDIIVQQHHERPNGSGFPRGLAHNYISPLSALFIVAHELAVTILSNKTGFTPSQFFEEKKALFSQGNFKKIFSALQKTVL